MKGMLLIFFYVIASVSLHSQNVGFGWAKEMAGASGSNASGISIVTDAAGNVYSTGYFQGTVDFDPGVGVFNLSSAANGTDLFISKLDAAGNFIWAKQIGGHTLDCSAISWQIVLDGSGNIYVTGYFADTVDFDPGPGISNLSSPQQITNFIVKLDVGGNFIWAKQMNGGNQAHSFSIAFDPAGNIYAAGGFEGTVDFDPGTAVFNLTSAGGSDIFILKLDAAGNFIWAKQMGGSDRDECYSIIVDVSNVYITGMYSGDYRGAGGKIFISKLDLNGNNVWTRMTGGGQANFDYANSIAVDASGNVYATGLYVGSGIFNLNPSVGDEDIFIAKLDANGKLVWAKQMGGAGFDQGLSIAVDASGNVYTTGAFSGVVDFDPRVCEMNSSPFDKESMFVSKLDATGKLIWIKQIVGPGNIGVSSMALDLSGNIYTTGDFNSTIDFDPGNATYNLTPLVGNFDIFVQKLIPCSNTTSSIISASACSSYTLNCRAYDSTGLYTQILSNAAGCDSIITLNLTIENTISTSTSNVQACKSYSWNGKIFTSSGNYTDTLMNATGCDSIAILHLTITDKSLSNITQTICDGQSYFGYNKSGTYIDTLISVNGCDSIRTLQLSVKQKADPDLGSGKILCSGDTLNLFPGQFDAYVWQDGSTKSHYTVNHEGSYSVDVSDQCGSGHAEIVIEEKLCDINFPSAFTPNNDGVNDVFKIVNAAALSDYDLAIYNRWGQKIFETQDFKKGWDGNLNGHLSETGVYIWSCKFKKSGSSQSKVVKGTVILIR